MTPQSPTRRSLSPNTEPMETINELFEEIPESKPNRLRAARIALEKAQEHYDSLRDARDNYDAQTAIVKWDIGESAMKLQDAQEELKNAELEAL